MSKSGPKNTQLRLMSKSGPKNTPVIPCIFSACQVCGDCILNSQRFAIDSLAIFPNSAEKRKREELGN